jgi:hypothetical protein
MLPQGISTQPRKPGLDPLAGLLFLDFRVSQDSDERSKKSRFGYLQPALLTSATALPTHWLGDRVGPDAVPCGV